MIFGNGKKNKGLRDEDLPEPNEGLPDSHRPSGLCPRCGKQSSFDHLGSLPVTFDSSYLVNRDGTKERTTNDRVSSLECRHCKQAVVVVEEEWVGDSEKKKSKKGGLVSYRGIYWWPLPGANLSGDIPTDIADVFDEAIVALAAKCPRASAVMSRRTLEAITVDKNESDGILFNRLESLKEKNVLQPELFEWAKEIRLIANKGAHFDPANPVTIEDAKQLIIFMQELMKYLYILPAELERRRNRKSCDDEVSAGK